MLKGHAVWGVGGGAVLRECLPVLRRVMAGC